MSSERAKGTQVTDGLADTPEPPYWAVIFSTRRHAQPGDEYDATARRMLTLAAQQPGYLGVEEAHPAAGTDPGIHSGSIGITVSYWSDETSIAAWRRDADHAFAQYEGRTRWYDAYELRVARVERAHSFRRDAT